MGDARDRRSPVLQSPPIDSQLRKYKDFIESLGWQKTVAEFREVEARHLFQTEPNWSRFPSPTMREFIVLPLLKKQGMPDGVTGPWFDTLIDCMVARMRDEFHIVETEQARLPSKNRGGQPKAPPLVRAIVFGAYLDANDELGLDVSHNRHIERAALRLSGDAKGSIGRSTVRRAVAAMLQEVGSVETPLQILWMRVVMSVRIAMAQYDSRNPAHGSLGYNSPPVAGYSGTRRPVIYPAFMRQGNV